MKRKLLFTLVVAVIACFSISLIGCGKDFKDVYNFEEKTYSYFFNTKLTGGQNGYHFKDSSSNLISFEQENTYGGTSVLVYNIEGAKLGEYVNSYSTINDVTLFEKYYIVSSHYINSENDSYSAFDMYGNPFYTDSEVAYQVTINNLFATYDKYYYIVKDGKVDFSSKVETKFSNLINIIKTINYKFDDKYYAIGEGVISVYDENLALIAHTSISSSYLKEIKASGILSNGNYFVQFDYKVDSNSEEYEYFNLDAKGVVEKHCLKNIIFDVDDNEVSIKNAEFSILYYYNMEAINAYDNDDIGVSNEIKACANIYEIQDKMVSNIKKYVEINDDLGYSELPSPIDNGTYVMAYDEDVYFAYNTKDEAFIVNGRGKVLASNIDTEKLTYSKEGKVFFYTTYEYKNQEYITKIVVYSKDLSKIIDTFESSGSIKVDKYQNVIQIKNSFDTYNPTYTTKVYINGVAKTYEYGQIENICDYGYVIKTSEPISQTGYKYTLYDWTGNQIDSANFSLNVYDKYYIKSDKTMYGPSEYNTTICVVAKKLNVQKKR